VALIPLLALFLQQAAVQAVFMALALTLALEQTEALAVAREMVHILEELGIKVDILLLKDITAVIAQFILQVVAAVALVPLVFLQVGPLLLAMAAQELHPQFQAQQFIMAAAAVAVQEHQQDQDMEAKAVEETALTLAALVAMERRELAAVVAVLLVGITVAAKAVMAVLEL
jgi:hypothetical protein